jgi:hypothetical protein
MWATCRFDDPAGVTTAGPAAAGLITGQRQEPNHRSYIDRWSGTAGHRSIRCDPPPNPPRLSARSLLEPGLVQVG